MQNEQKPHHLQTLPTEKDLERLPTWYIPTIAIRAIDRISSIGQAPEIHIDNVVERTNSALAYARDLLTTGTAPNGGEPISMVGSTFSIQGYSVHMYLSDAVRFALKPGALAAMGGRKDIVIQGVVESLRHSIHVLHVAMNPPQQGPHRDPVVAAIKPEHEEQFLADIWNDIGLISSLARELGWTNSTLVNFDFLGAIWSQTPPDWWIDPLEPEVSAHAAMIVELRIPLEATSPETDEQMATALAAISAMHAQLSGRVLRIMDEESFRADGILEETTGPVNRRGQLNV